MVKRSTWAVAALCLIGFGPAAVAEQPQGSLVIVGGALRLSESQIWAQIVELAGGEGAKIAVFPTASPTPVDSGRRAAAALDDAGADAFLVPLGVHNIDLDFRQVATDEAVIEQVRAAGGVFFTGGDQKRITMALFTPEGRNTPLLDAVWEVYRKGGVIAGTSAGAAVLSRVMFSEPDTVLTTLERGVEYGKEIDAGLGFMDHSWFIEQHCLTRGRFARALVAMHSQGLKYGIGVDENTAVVVKRGSEVSIVGYRGAVVLDLSSASHDPEVKGFNLKNAKLTYLDSGDGFDLHTLAVTPAKNKQAGAVAIAKAAEIGAEPAHRYFSNDVLGNTTVVDLLSRVMQTRKVEAIGLAFDGAKARQESTRGFEFRFYPAEDSCGWYGDVYGTSSYTISNIHLDIRPVEITGPLYK